MASIVMQCLIFFYAWTNVSQEKKWLKCRVQLSITKIHLCFKQTLQSKVFTMCVLNFPYVYVTQILMSCFESLDLPMTKIKKKFFLFLLD